YMSLISLIRESSKQKIAGAKMGANGQFAFKQFQGEHDCNGSPFPCSGRPRRGRGTLTYGQAGGKTSHGRRVPILFQKYQLDHRCTDAQRTSKMAFRVAASSGTRFLECS